MWGPEGAGNEIRAASRRGLVFVNDATEYVSASNTVEGDEGLCPRRWLFDWRSLSEGAVGAMLVGDAPQLSGTVEQLVEVLHGYEAVGVERAMLQHVC